MIAACLIGAAGLVFAAPLLIQDGAIDAYESSIDKMEEHMSGSGVTFKIEPIETTSGMYSADITSRVTFYKDPEKALCFDVLTNLEYGPKTLLSGAIASAHTELLPITKQEPSCGMSDVVLASDSLREFYQANFGEGSPVVADSKFNLLGDTEIKYKLKPFVFEYIEKGKKLSVNMSKVTGFVWLNDAAEITSAEINMGGLETTFEEKGNTIQMGFSKLSVVGQNILPSKKNDAQKIQTTYAQRIENLFIASTKEAGSPVIGIDELNITNVIDRKGAYQDSDFGLSINGVHVKDDKHPDKVQMGNLGAQIIFNKINSLEVENLANYMESIAETGDVNLLTKKLMAKSITEILKEAKVNLKNVNYSLNDKRISVDGQIYLDGLTINDLQPAAGFPFSLINKLHMTFSAFADKSITSDLSKLAVLAKSNDKKMTDDQLLQLQAKMTSTLDSFLENVIKTGHVKYDVNKDQYLTEFKFDAGKATVNDKQIPL